MSDVNIKVSALDHLAEAAKELIQKVITPPLEEVGLLLTDRVRLWRFANQIKIVAKAEEYLKREKISTRKVSLKVLAPLLEDCSLEEDDSLREKWSALLVNTVKEGSAIDNSLFSSILGQLSSKDANLLDLIWRTSVQTQKAPKATVWIHNEVKMDLSQIKKDNPDSIFSIDNLIRLRLLKEVDTANLSSQVMITHLGVRLVINCTYPDF